MENNFDQPNKQAYLDQLTKLGIYYMAHHHDPVPTMEEVVKINVEDVYIKNLLYVDKKSNYYLILAANHTTQVAILYWKTLELQIVETLKSSEGNVNPFAVFNDTNNLVKNIIIDEELSKYKRLALYPIENTTTVEILLDDQYLQILLIFLLIFLLFFLLLLLQFQFLQLHSIILRETCFIAIQQKIRFLRMVSISHKKSRID